MSCAHTKQNSWWLNDAKGIPLRRVCAQCVEEVKKKYAPAIFDPDRYTDVVEEQIEEDY